MLLLLLLLLLGCSAAPPRALSGAFLLEVRAESGRTSRTAAPRTTFSRRAEINPASPAKPKSSSGALRFPRADLGATLASPPTLRDEFDPLEDIISARQKTVATALTQVPERLQLVLSLRFVEEFSVKEVGDLLGVSKLRTRLPQALSGGEMQRVSIARALVTQPQLVLADEPTGNLSSKAGEEVVQLLRSVCTKLKATILLVTHTPRDAAAGDRVLFLHDGAMRADAELTGGPFRVADVFHRLEELGI